MDRNHEMSALIDAIPVAPRFELKHVHEWYPIPMDALHTPLLYPCRCLCGCVLKNDGTILPAVIT